MENNGAEGWDSGSESGSDQYVDGQEGAAEEEPSESQTETSHDDSDAGGDEGSGNWDNQSPDEGTDVDESVDSENIDTVEEQESTSRHEDPALSSERPLDDEWSDEDTEQHNRVQNGHSNKPSVGRGQNQSGTIPDEENQAGPSSQKAKKGWIGGGKNNDEVEDEDRFENEPEQAKRRGRGSYLADKNHLGPDTVEEYEDTASRYSRDRYTDWDSRSGGSRYSQLSSIEATQERKVITCLVLVVCCMFMLVILGTGIGIGVAIGKNSEEKQGSGTKPVPDPTAAPVTPTPAPATQVPGPLTPTAAPVNPLPTGAPSIPSETPTIQTPVPSSQPSPFPSGNPSGSPVTEAPSSSPTADPDQVINLLVEQSFDGGTALRSAGTPQRNAYEWLLTNANLDSYSEDTILARYALATFFYSTNGPTSWDASIRDNGWMTDAPECDWASTANNQCTDGVYTSLTIDFAGVTGGIPLEIGHLTGLTRLSLRSNGAGEPTLSGSVPETMGKLTDLVTIRLNGNEIGGTLPTELGLMTAVRVLLLSGNSIGGNIPSEIGLISGTTINLDGNDFEGAIPDEMFNVASLAVVNLGDNRLSDSIPTEIGTAANLNSIFFGNNELTGPIPSEMGRLASIRAGIDLSGNFLVGALPSEIGLLAGMRNFEVQNNRLTGPVPLEYSNLGSLRVFRIDGNPSITGGLSEATCTTFTSSNTISYSDCSGEFLCPCCTFCCSGTLCECNAQDPGLCDV